ncbi:MAG: hypothetical protein L0Z53_01345, partial [Acidobacteriales bacterium]|nr:hypothetical protein [Terriglobales bacterium]
GYRGIVVSDDLGMAGATVAGSVEAAAVATVRAGSDIYLVCHELDRVWASYQAVLREVEQDKGLANQVTRSAQRLFAFKKRMGSTLRPPASPPSARTMEQLRSKLQAFSQKLIDTQPRPADTQPLATAAK